ncbi:MAG: peptide ligase PGM1-related protein [Woeseia sp.]
MSSVARAKPVTDPAEEIARFDALKGRLRQIWTNLKTDPNYEHTSVILPSLSVNQEELAKVLGASFYEERLMFALIRLRNPNARLIYITSQPVHAEVVEYYLHLLDDVPFNHARQRLHMLSVYDSSTRPLTEKILERPRFLERLRKLIGDTDHAYLTCYNSTVLERRLAVRLGIPLNGVDPALLDNGTKSGSRKAFAEAGINFPTGFEDLHSENDIVDALLRLQKQRPGIKRAVVKLNEGFSGEGNGVFTYPSQVSGRDGIRAALSKLGWSSGLETYRSFMRKFNSMGGIVEEMIEADEVHSPSVQMRIHPDGQSALVSSHEQVLGGSTGQVYLGCHFPASDEYRWLLQEEAEKVGEVLSRKGVIGRFGIDFLVCRTKAGGWTSYAIEINLRMGGTTPPFHALEFLTGGQLDSDSGLFRTPTGETRYYCATDNLKSPAYRGLLPEDLFEITSRNGLGFRHTTGTGVLFYMIGALSQYGKLGMTCIGHTLEEAQSLYERTVAVLDEQTEGGGHGVAAPLLDRYLTME